MQPDISVLVPGFPAPKFVDAGGVRLATYECGEGPTIVFVHGWPEIAYSWKNQLPAVASAGYRGLAVDLKGFGASDAPRDPALYDIDHMTDDLAALLDAEGIERAVFCGHDWGGWIVWAMAQLKPERVAGIIAVSTPLKPRPPAPPLAIIEKRFTPNHYFVRFQAPDAPEALFESDIERFVPFMFQGPVPKEKWPSLVPGVFDVMGRFAEGRAPNPKRVVMSGEDLQVYVDAYRRSGFHGGINLYRNLDRNWALMDGRNEIVRAPSLWIAAELDLFLPPESASGMRSLVPDLEERIISGCGHWVSWERPDELNAIIVDWLDRRMRDKF